MKPLDLNQQEREVLVRVLERCQADLDHEIRHTDNGEFKQMLRQRLDFIAGITRKLHTSLDHACAA